MTVDSQLPTASCLAVALLVAGCAGAADEAVRPAPVVRWDSAGVEIVDNPEYAPDTVSLSFDSVPRVSIGDETRGDAYIFSQIVAVGWLSDGSIVVADGARNAMRIAVFDSLGNHIRNIGRRGAGPGEYASIRDLFFLPGDTIAALSVYDAGPLIYYDARGNHARALLRTEFPADADIGRYRTEYVLGAFADGTVLSMLGWQPMWASAARLSLPIGQPQFYNDSGKLVRGVPPDDPVAVYSVVTRERGAYYPRPPRESGFHDTFVYAQPSVAIRGMHVMHADGESFEIREFAPDGNLRRIIRKAHTPVAVPRRWSDSVSRELRSMFRRYPGSEWIADAPAPEPPTSAPAIDRLIVDDEGNLWVHSNQRGRSPAAPIWFVFDSTGVLTHSLRADIPRVASIGRGHLIGVWQDSLGVPEVRALRIRKQ